MGSPKAAKSMVKQRIWRHRLVAPFAAVLITAVVVFSGLFAQDPSATSEFTAVNAGNTLPVRDKSESTGNRIYVASKPVPLSCLFMAGRRSCQSKKVLFFFVPVEFGFSNPDRISRI